MIFDISVKIRKHSFDTDLPGQKQFCQKVEVVGQNTFRNLAKDILICIPYIILSGYPVFVIVDNSQNSSAFVEFL
ncbi:hypothetical protein B5F07_19795 [Lachnoclostridium sp. An169]|nr:hypothetical protein B5F07_19795 [Lachnoclostridium sp. An169]